MRESEMNGDVLPPELVEEPFEVESLQEPKSLFDDYPHLLCEIAQCRHWTTVDNPSTDLGRCSMENVTIGQKTLTIYSGGLEWQTKFPDPVCRGFEYHDRYYRQNDPWEPLVVLDRGAIDGSIVCNLVYTFRISRGLPSGDFKKDLEEYLSDELDADDIDRSRRRLVERLSRIYGGPPAEDPTDE